MAQSFAHFPTQLSSLTALTKLCIEPSSVSLQDLSAYSQLKFLWIGPEYGNLQAPVLLPCGPEVSLQTLYATSDCILHDLASATGLTQLQVQDSHFEWMQWPTSLVRLQTLRLHQFNEVHGIRGEGFQYMPPEWQHYTSLQTLGLGPYEPSHYDSSHDDSSSSYKRMPEWFSSLKQLTRLDLAGAAVLDFRACWICFSQLQHLNLRCYESKIHRDVLILAEAPQLTYLSFADLGEDRWNYTGTSRPSDECVENLERLAAAIKKSHVQPSKLFRINVRRFWYEWQAETVVGVPRL